MKRQPYRRFCNALQTITVSHLTDNPEFVLVIGSSDTDPIDCMLAILKPLELVVIEIDASAVAFLQQASTDPAVRIVHGNAADLAISAPRLYDLVIIRHPDIERFNERWSAVFEAVAAYLIDAGILLVSAYSLSEVDLLRNCLSQVGLSLTYSPELSSEPVDLQGNDRYLLLGQKE